MVKLSVLFTSSEIDCAILLFRSMPVQSQLPFQYVLLDSHAAVHCSCGPARPSIARNSIERKKKNDRKLFLSKNCTRKLNLTKIRFRRMECNSIHEMVNFLLVLNAFESIKFLSPPVLHSHVYVPYVAACVAPSACLNSV